MFMDNGTLNNLMKGIYYRLSIKHFQSVCKSGVIEAKKEFQPHWPATPHSVSYNYTYIPLFDFESAGEKRSREMIDSWIFFFSDLKPVTIILKLDREALPEIISNPYVKKTDGFPDPPYLLYIHWVEAWYPKPIPISAITGCYLSRPHKIATLYSFQETKEIIAKEFGLNPISPPEAM